MNKELPPYLSTNQRGEFYNLAGNRVAPVLRTALSWGRSYFGILPLLQFSKTFLALLWTSLIHSLQASPTSSI